MPDLVAPMSEYRTFKYFREGTLEKYARQYSWTLIDGTNRKDMFMDMIRFTGTCWGTVNANLKL